MMTNLSNYSLQELRALLEQVDQQLSERDGLSRARARQEILAIAQSAGIKLKDLAKGKLGNSKPGSAPVRFRNPSDASQQWSGRGPRPQWVKTLLEAGKKMDDLRTDQVSTK